MAGTPAKMLGPLGAIAGSVWDLLVDSGVNEALSPSEGLQVNSITFQSVEQEGRWKGMGYHPTRVNTNPIWPSSEERRKIASHATSTKPGRSLSEESSASPPLRPSKSRSNRFLRINVPAPIQADWVERLQHDLNRAGIPKSGLLEAGMAEIRVEYSYDYHEIWSGWVGLSSAKGFKSLYGHRAKVEISGTPHGNYLPAEYLITANGYINPIGLGYIEFKCAAAISAEGVFHAVTLTDKGEYNYKEAGKCWDRDGHDWNLGLDSVNGFTIDLSKLVLPPRAGY